MGIGTSLGGYFETPIDHEAGNDTGVVAPKSTGDDNALPPDADTQKNPKDQPEAPIEANDRPRVIIRTPRQAPTEAADALVSNSHATVYPEPYGLNPPDREAHPPLENTSDYGGIPPEGIQVNPLVHISRDDIDTGINVAMGAGSGTMEDAGKYKNYIDMFLKEPENMTKGELKPFVHNPEFEQVPFENTFTDQFGHKVDLNKLSNKQNQDFGRLIHDYNSNHITHGEYLDEMNEYVKFTQGKIKNVPISVKGKIKEFDADNPPLTHGQKILHDLLDDYPDILESHKQTPKEKFIDALEKTHGKLVSTLANIRDTYLNTVKQNELEPHVPPIPEAAAQGYTQPAYRGIHIYEPNALNPVHDFDAEKMYSTASPMLADMYANYLSKHPGYKVPEGTFNEGSQVMPLYINTKDYYYYDAKGEHWTKANGEAMKEARKSGKKGVIVDNVRDEPGSTVSLPPKKIFITFKSGASTVKSRFAKNFDPSSPNILHGIGSVGAAGAAAGILTSEGDHE